MRRLIVAVDGPAGAGKSSSSRLLAARLGYRHIDTGALYRAVALVTWEQGVNPTDPVGLAAVCEHLAFGIVQGPQEMRLLMGERDITADLRRPEISQIASQVSAQPVVRQRLLVLQRELGQEGGVVIEGRDIGTVVFPDADVKFYLDASPEERGRRRYGELQQQRSDANLTTITEEIRTRDHRDSTRAHAPLRPADDAVVVDTTSVLLEEVVARLYDQVQRVACKS